MKLRRLLFVTTVILWLGMDSLCVAAVEYELIFESTWSSATHPTDFPSANNPHYSGLFGATHDDGFSLWEPGALATTGVKNVAETGSGAAILQEIVGGGTSVFDQVRLSGIGTPASGTTTFDAEATHSLVSFVTMIAPSPDWIVGVHDVDLRANGLWIPELVLDAHPYDAGTDSGASYRSSNQATNPRETIFLINDGVFTGTPPLGTFTLRLLTDIPDGDFDDNGELAIADIDQLVSEIVAGSNGAAFDITGDGQVDLLDRDAWLAEAGGFVLGDQDLNGDVDSTDLGLLLNNFAGSGITYSGGNLNGDAIVDSVDLGLLLNNFGNTAALSQAVPEPSSLGWVLLCVAGVFVRASHRRLSLRRK